MALRKPPPSIGESRTGYFTRFAKENSASPIGLLNEAKSCKKKFDQSNSHLIILQDVTSTYFSNILDEKHHDTLKTMTFQPIFEKFTGYNLDSEPTSTRFWAGVISNKMRFCPQCLLEENIHRLQWQIKELTVCQKHSVKLLDHCPNCSMQIPLLSPNSMIGFCPFCGVKLRRTVRASVEELVKSNLALNYWDEIFESERISPIVPGCSVPESIAAGILYLKTDGIYRNKLLTSSDENLLSSLRGQSKNKIVHINRLINVLKEFNLSVKDFSNLDLPPEFIESLIRPQKPLITPNSARAKRSMNPKETTDLVLKLANEWAENNEKVTIGRVCKELGLSDGSLKKLGLTPVITAVAKRQRNSQKKIIEEAIREKFEALLNSFNNQVTWKEVFDRLGYHRSQLRERYPELYKYIRQQVDNHNAAMRQMNVSDLIAVTAEVLDERNFLGQFTSVEELARIIDFHPRTLPVKYPEVVEFLKRNRIDK